MPTALAVITQMQPIAVLFTIPADNLPPVLSKLRAGASCRVDAYDRADRNKIATGTLLTVDNQIDPTTGTSRLKADFRERRQRAVPESVRQLPPAAGTSKHSVVIVPAAAIQRGPQRSVRLRRECRTRPSTMRPVTVGITEGNDVEVTSGSPAARWWSPTGRTNCRTAARWTSRTPNAPGTPSAAAHAEGRETEGMSPSRPFILRPVATSLLMAGILLAGFVAYRQLPVSALPEVDYPDHPGAHVLSRRQPGGDGVVGHRAARAAVRPGARAEADDLDQLVRQLGHHAAVRARSEHRRRRAAGAGGDQRRAARILPRDLPNPPIYSKTNPADAPILTLALTSKSAAAVEGGGLRRHHAGAEDLAAAGRRPGEHQRRADAGRAHPGEPDGARRLRPEPGRPAHRARARPT